MPSIQKIGNSWRVKMMVRGINYSKYLKGATESDAKQFATAFNANLRARRLDGVGATLTKTQLNRLRDRAKSRAADRKIDFHITQDDVYALFDKSGGFCEVTGIPFDLSKMAGVAVRPWGVSIDRRDSAKPYTVDNCRLVCVAVNMALGQWGDDVLRTIAEAIVFKVKL